MDIRKLRDNLKKFKKLSIEELAILVGESSDDIKPILSEWERRGKIIATTETSLCGSGCGCSAAKLSECDIAPKLLYSWIQQDL